MVRFAPPRGNWTESPLAGAPAGDQLLAMLQSVLVPPVQSLVTARASLDVATSQEVAANPRLNGGGDANQHAGLLATVLLAPGVIEPGALYEAPYTGLHADGPRSTRVDARPRRVRLAELEAD